MLQTKFVTDVWARFGMDDSQEVKTPANPTAAYANSATKPDETPCDLRLYKSLIGSLMFAAVCTRPDITFIIGVLSRFNEHQTNSH